MKKAYGVLKTFEDMEHDYAIAQYPYDKNVYDYFVGLATSNNKPAPTSKPAQSGTWDKHGVYKPTKDTVDLGKALRDIFTNKK